MTHAKTARMATATTADLSMIELWEGGYHSELYASEMTKHGDRSPATARGDPHEFEGHLSEARRHGKKWCEGRLWLMRSRLIETVYITRKIVLHRGEPNGAGHATDGTINNIANASTVVHATK